MRSRIPYPCCGPSETAFRMSRSNVPGSNSAWFGMAKSLLNDIGELCACSPKLSRRTPRPYIGIVYDHNKKYEVAGIDWREKNRSRFVAEAVRRELDRRRRAELRRSLNDPHP